MQFRDCSDAAGGGSLRNHGGAAEVAIQFGLGAATR